MKQPPRVSSLRESSSKKSGGQKGHPGETLRRIETADATIHHYPEARTACGEPLLMRMSTRKQDVLRFLTDPTVPFTNNLAEQDGRML